MTARTLRPERREDASTQDHELYELRKRKNPSRIIFSFFIVLSLAGLIFSFAKGGIDWNVVGSYFFTQSILLGLWNTIWLSIVCMVIGIVLGAIFAVMRLSSNPVASFVAWLYVWSFRGTPVLVQMFIWFNIALVFPRIGWGTAAIPTIEVVTPAVAAILGLGLNQGAYLTEIFRGGLLSVDHGQHEAGAALGVHPRTTLLRVIVPQAMPAILPPTGNEAITLLKTTSLAAVIAFPELLSRAQTIYFVNGRVVELLFVAAGWYILATTILTTGQYYVEKYFSKGSKTWVPSVPDRIISHFRDQLIGRGVNK